jgi:hypothetical protein
VHQRTVSRSRGTHPERLHVALRRLGYSSHKNGPFHSCRSCMQPFPFLLLHHGVTERGASPQAQALLLDLAGGHEQITLLSLSATQWQEETHFFFFSQIWPQARPSPKGAFPPLTRGTGNRGQHGQCGILVALFSHMVYTKVDLMVEWEQPRNETKPWVSSQIRKGVPGARVHGESPRGEHGDKASPAGLSSRLLLPPSCLWGPDLEQLDRGAWSKFWPADACGADLTPLEGVWKQADVGTMVHRKQVGMQGLSPTMQVVYSK